MSKIPGAGIYRARSSLLGDYIFTPPIVPQTVDFVQKSHRNFGQKKFPQSPLKGDGGNGFRGLDGGASIGYIRGKPRPRGPGPANRRRPGGVQKGEVNVDTSNIGELLVEQAKEAERLRLKLLEVNRLAGVSKDLDSFRRELDRLNKQQ